MAPASTQIASIAGSWWTPSMSDMSMTTRTSSAQTRSWWQWPPERTAIRARAGSATGSFTACSSACRTWALSPTSRT